MFIRRMKSRRGSVLPVVLIVFAIMMILATVSLFLSSSQSSLNKKYEDKTGAIHYADAGVNQYLWYLNSSDSEASVETDTDVAYEGGFYRLHTVSDGEGFVKIQSTGWSADDPEQRRTVECTLTKRSFANYVYLSDNDGSDIKFATGDLIYGPYHTNTTLRVMGSPIFFGKATYVNSYAADAGASPVFKMGRERVQPLTFPSSNTELRVHAQQNGYYYEGRTCILLNSDGTITVRNPNVSGGSAVTMNLPPNGVIYVNGAKDTSFNPRGSNRFNLDRGNVFISGTLKGKLTVAAADSIYITSKDPTNYNFGTATITNGITYATTDFSVNATTGETTVTGTGDDMLGLVANNSVYVQNYGWPDEDGYESLTRDTTVGDVKVYAAIFAMSHRIANESCYEAGRDNTDYSSARPTTERNLIIRGSMIQNTRGVVAITSGSTTRGYNKNYVHDPRMTYNSPPHFTAPVNSGWEINEWREVTLSGGALLESLYSSVGTLYPSFSPLINDYTVSLPYGSETPVITATAQDGGTVSINQPGFAGDTAAVTVTSEDGSATNVYNIDFNVALNTDAALQGITVGGNPLTGFSPATLNYSVELPYGSTAPAAVSAVARDTVGARIQIDQAVTLADQAVIQVTAADGTTVRTYTLSFTVGLDTDNTLSDLSVGGVTVSGFSPNILIYNVELPRGTTTAPVVVAVKNSPNAAMTTTQAPSLTGTAIVTVTAQNGAVRTYRVVFSVSKNNDATLRSISIRIRTGGSDRYPSYSSFSVDGVTPGTTTYIYTIPFVMTSDHSTYLPTAFATASDSNATVVVTKDADWDDGQALIRVTAEDGVTVKTYTVNYKLPRPVIGLFTSWGSTYYDVTCFPYTSADLYTASGTKITTIYLDNDGYGYYRRGSYVRSAIVAKTGWLTSDRGYYGSIPSSDATLSSILVNGTSLPGFNPGAYDYTYTLPAPVTSIPSVSATATDADASVAYSQASASNGVAVITVTAEDGSTQAYTVRFKLPMPVVTRTGINYNIACFPNAKASVFQSNGSLYNSYNLSGTGTYSFAKNAAMSYVIVSKTGWIDSDLVNFSGILSNDATLDGIKINGLNLPGFNSSTYDYTYTLPSSTTSLPVATVTESDDAANVSITQASDGDGRAIIRVTAEDGTTTLTYTVRYKLPAPVVITNTRGSWYNREYQYQITGFPGAKATLYTSGWFGGEVGNITLNSSGTATTGWMSSADYVVLSKAGWISSNETDVD